MNETPSIKELREQKRQAKLDRRSQATRSNKTQRWWLWGGSAIGLAAILGGMVYLAQPEASNTNDSVLGLQATDHVKGSRTAPAVLIEYSDFQCPACESYYPLVKQLAADFPDTLAIVYRHYPLRQIHQFAQPAALAAEAADQQGKFWEYHDLLFDNHDEWANSSNARPFFIEYAKELKLDVDQFESDMDGSAASSRVNADVNSGDDAKVNSTPSFFLNGQKLTNPGTAEAFKVLVEDAIKNRPISQPEDTKTHLHADIRVLVDGQAMDFTKAEYQSTKDRELSSKAHWHAGVGHVFHVHEKNTSLNDLLTSVGMKLTKDCLTVAAGQDKCADASRVLKFFVNGQENSQSGDYQPKDLDRIVVAYGAMTPAELSEVVDSVTDEACIFSETCPERGTPPTEECVGGLGTDCE